MWQCLEWRLDATDNRVELWIDGIAQPDLTVTTTTTAATRSTSCSPADNVKIGWQLYQPNPGRFDLWLDDIALATERIGC